MRSAAVIVCLFLCFGLFGGSNAAHANFYKCLSAAQAIQKTPVFKLVPAINDYLKKGSSTSDDSSFVVVVEDDDEELPIRKYTSLVSYLQAFSLAFLAKYGYSNHAILLFDRRHPSCINAPKYIVQRVLRR
jgi:hypothetical protein